MSHKELLEIDAAEFADGFDRRPFAVRHQLADHPMLTVDAIADLADRLPDEASERHRADQPLVAAGGVEDLDESPGEIVRGIEHNGRWMVLWNIEQVPEYKALLDACLDDAEAFVTTHGGQKMANRQGFIFLSAPNAVTPWHFDPEHNLLLQIRGSKGMNVGRFADEETALRELDRYHDGGHRNLDNPPGDVTTFDMSPGDGVYVYPWAPHWVQNGPAVSVSLSITFRTRNSERAERVHRMNARLRARGLHPQPPGHAGGVDRAKASVMASLDRMRGHRSGAKFS